MTGTGATTMRLSPYPSKVSSPTQGQAGSVARLVLRLQRLEVEPPPGAGRQDEPVPDIDGASAHMAAVVDLARQRPTTDTTLGRWSAVAAAAHDACLVLDPQGQVVSLSAAAAELLDCSDAGVIGRPLLDVTTLIDFDTGEPRPPYEHRVPPLAALSSDGIVRGLIRIRHTDDALVTLDVCGMPLHDAAGRIVGSLSFVSPLAG